MKTTEQVHFSELSKEVQRRVLLHWWRGTFRVDHPNVSSKIEMEIERSLRKTGDFNLQEIIERHIQPLVKSETLFSKSGNSVLGYISPNMHHRAIVHFHN